MRPSAPHTEDENDSRAPWNRMGGVWPEEEVISLRDLLQILYRGRWLLV